MRRAVATLVALTLAGGIAACGSEDDKDPASGATSTSATSGGSTSAVDWQAERDKLLATDEFDWPKPTEAYDPGTGRLAIVSCGEADAGCHTLTVGAQEAAKAAGWTSKVFDTAFDTNKAGGFVQQAVAQKYDGIILGAINPTLIQAAVAAATKAGIPIGCAVCVTPDSAEYENVLDATSGGAAGAAEAIGVIAESGGTAKAAYFFTPGQAIEKARTEALRAKFDECEECSLEVLEVPLGDLAKPGPPFFTGFLSTPLAKQVDWILASSDAYTVPAMKTAIDRGLTDYSFGGTAATKDMTVAMTKPDPVAKITVAESYRYASWAATDNVMRRVADAPTWDATSLPVALVTTENAKHYARGGELTPPEGIPATFEPFWTDE